MVTTGFGVPFLFSRYLTTWGGDLGEGQGWNVTRMLLVSVHTGEHPAVEMEWKYFRHRNAL